MAALVAPVVVAAWFSTSSTAANNRRGCWRPPTMSAGDPRADAEAYLKENNVKQLFRDLGTKLMFERPTDPNACGLPAWAFLRTRA